MWLITKWKSIQQLWYCWNHNTWLCGLWSSLKEQKNLSVLLYKLGWCYERVIRAFAPKVKNPRKLVKRKNFPWVYFIYFSYLFFFRGSLFWFEEVIYATTSTLGVIYACLCMWMWCEAYFRMWSVKLVQEYISFYVIDTLWEQLFFSEGNITFFVDTNLSFSSQKHTLTVEKTYSKVNTI